MLDWNEIHAFELDPEVAEYGFQTRLAEENDWSLSFTERAIEEYKKFMYLAAISDRMVSPSEIVDVVWHQHLIYTKSYQALGERLGKRIEHVPSLHHASEKAKFDDAFAHTLNLYREHFGEPPADIWRARSFLAELDEKPDSWKEFLLPPTHLFVVLGICAMFYYPFFLLMRPLFLQIDGPFFLIGYGLMAAATIFALIIHRMMFHSDWMQYLYSHNIIHDLRPMELVYLQSGKKTKAMVHGVVSHLIDTQKIQVGKDYILSTEANPKEAETPYERAVLQTIKKEGEMYYPALMAAMVQKKVFLQTAQFVDRLEGKLKKSHRFGAFVSLRLLVWGLLLEFGLMRLHLGILRDKPVGYLVAFLILLGVAALFSEARPIHHFITKTIPEFYIRRAKEVSKSTQGRLNWEWQYVLLGATFFAAAFQPLYGYTEKNDKSGGGSCGSSCGSSCGGGSCGGGGCGGCGGGD